jgi:hypothetical protein
MKTGTNTAKLPITSIVARGSCPICTALREFQTDMLKKLLPTGCARLCNTHAWAVANSAPAESVATIFLGALANPHWRASAPVPDDCDLCKKMQAEKEARLNEIAQQLSHPKLRDWLHDYGMLCSRHSHEAMARLPDDLQKSVQEVVVRNAGELAEALGEFLEQVKKGSHAGGGVLGRAAEFLVAQRGIES